MRSRKQNHPLVEHIIFREIKEWIHLQGVLKLFDYWTKLTSLVGWRQWKEKIDWKNLNNSKPWEDFQQCIEGNKIYTSIRMIF